MENVDKMDLMDARLLLKEAVDKVPTNPLEDESLTVTSVSFSKFKAKTVLASIAGGKLFKLELLVI